MTEMLSVCLPSSNKCSRMPQLSNNVHSILRQRKIRLVLRIFPGVRQRLNIARVNLWCGSGVWIRCHQEAGFHGFQGEAVFFFLPRL